jgi:hypothetical protein
MAQGTRLIDRIRSTILFKEKNMSESIVILGAARTPMGAFQGDFASLSANDLGGAANPGCRRALGRRVRAGQ